MNLVSLVVPHLCGLPKAVRDKRLLMMLRGFFDESNRSPKDDYFILAGWTATVEEWEKFSEAWNQCLAAAPSIRYFTLKEANGLNGEFGRFSRASAEVKKLALAKVISAHDLRGYLGAAPWEMMADKPKELKKLMATRIYDWAFISLIGGVLSDRIEREDSDGKIDFIFDGCTELRACIESYERERAKWPFSWQNIAGEIIPGDDHDLVGLQAADFLAGEFSLHFRNKQPSDVYKAMMTSHLVVCMEAIPPKKLKAMYQYAQRVFERQAATREMMKIHKSTGGDLRKMTQSEFDTFSKAMDTILKASPEDVKAAMEAGKRERAEEAAASGKRGRGRPPNKSSASGPASS